MSEDNNRDLDAQFRDLVADMESDLEGDLPQGAGEEASTTRSALDTPVDESLHLEGGKLSVALVLAPIPSAEALHSLLALSGIHEAVVRLKPWTGVWLRVQT